MVTFGNNCTNTHNVGRCLAQSNCSVSLKYYCEDMGKAVAKDMVVVKNRTSKHVGK